MKFIFGLICGFLLAVPVFMYLPKDIIHKINKHTSSEGNLEEQLRKHGSTFKKLPSEKGQIENVDYDITIETNTTPPPVIRLGESVEVGEADNHLNAAQIIERLKKAGCKVEEIDSGGGYKSYEFSWTTEYSRPSTGTIVRVGNEFSWNPRKDTYDDLLKIKEGFRLSNDIRLPLPDFLRCQRHLH